LKAVSLDNYIPDGYSFTGGDQGESIVDPKLPIDSCKVYLNGMILPYTDRII